VLTLANELGLTEVEPRSYLRMALEAAFSARPGLLESADGSPSD
jgi:hypothetical protein